MKKYTLQTVSDAGELIKESTLELREGSVLVVQPTMLTTVEQLCAIHEFIANALNEGREVLTIPFFAVEGA